MIEQIYQFMFSTKNKLALVVLALLGFMLVFLPTSRYGAGVSPDSVGYVAAARNLRTGVGFLTYDKSPLIVQPPLFPILLALAGGLLNTDPLVLANMVNAFIFALIVYFGGLLTFKHLSSFPVFAFIGSLAILASIPLFKISVMIWSEALFILFVILSLLFVNSYIEKNDVTSLTLLSLSVALATLTRYIGVTLILWGALIISAFYRDRLKKKIDHLSLFMFISVLPIGIWLIRNYVISNTFFGPRAPSMYTLPQNLMFVFNDLMTWYIPSIVADHRPTLILLGVLIGFFAGLNPKNSWQSIKDRLQQIGPIVLFVIIYTAFLVISSTTTAYDPIGDRLLSPIYIPLTLLFLLLTQAFVESWGGQQSNKTVNLLLIIVPVVWLLAYPIRNIIINAVNFASIGQGYSSKAWLESQTVQYLIQHQTLESECTIYTNAPDAAYILADLTTITTPAKTSYNSQESQNDISNLKKFWLVDKNKVCLIWFDKVNRQNLFTIDELQTVAKFNLIAHLNDGAIYSVTQNE